MQKQFLLLTSLALTSGIATETHAIKGAKSPSGALYSAMNGYSANPSPTERTDFDGTLKPMLKCSDKQTIIDDALMNALETFDDIYMTLKLIGAGAQTTRRMVTRPRGWAEKQENLKKQKAKHYGFTISEYQTLLDNAYVLAKSHQRNQKQLDALAEMLVSNKKADRKKGQEQLAQLVQQVTDSQ